MAKKGTIFLNLLNLSPEKISAILSSLEDIDRILKVEAGEFRNIPFLQSKDIEHILALRASGDLEREVELIAKEGIDCLDIFDSDYPRLLREINNPPPVLYLRGNRKVLNKFLFAIVGSRTPSGYGIAVAGDFSAQLSRNGMVIISGLARGIDTAAHAKALENGETVAVLGSGLLNLYPRENKALAEKIALRGAVVSEFPMLTAPLKENFPRRNRVVSGLARGVLVVEAASRSGALITARLACEQNREVFAIPGSIDSFLSKGTHLLIKEGAKLVDGLEDILEELSCQIVKL
jgi:DNA processing protein